MHVLVLQLVCLICRHGRTLQHWMRSPLTHELSLAQECVCDHSVNDFAGHACQTGGSCMLRFSSCPAACVLTCRYAAPRTGSQEFHVLHAMRSQ